MERAAEIVRRNVVEAAEPLVNAATAFVIQTRELDLDKPPGVAEAIDWVGALHTLGVTSLDITDARSTMGAIVKTPDDLQRVNEAILGGSLAVGE